MTEEDGALTFEHDAECGELKLHGQGEMHLRVTVERLAARFGVEVETGKPTVAYRETIRDAVQARGRLKKQSGGHGQFGDVLVEVAPRGRGEGFAFAEKIHGGTVPRNYFPSVEIGSKEALQRGPLGFPVVDVAVTLLDGSYHTVNSSDMAFRAAAKIALGEALPKARPVLLEPVQAVDIHVPAEAIARATRFGVEPARPDPRLRAAPRLGRLGDRQGADSRSRDRRSDRGVALGDRRRRRFRGPLRSSGRAFRQAGRSRDRGAAEGGLGSDTIRRLLGDVKAQRENGT